MSKQVVNVVTMAMVKREQDSNWESAVALLKAPGLSDPVHLVTVSDGKVLEDVYTYTLVPDYGSFIINIPSF